MGYFSTYKQELASCDREIARLDPGKWPHRIATEQARRAAVEADRKARGKRMSDKFREHEMSAELRAAYCGEVA